MTTNQPPIDAMAVNALFLKDFLELLVKEHNFPLWLANDFMIVIYIITLGIAIYQGIKLVYKLLRKRFLKKIISKDLHPYFTHNEIYNYTKLYIPQYFQNITGSEGDEPGKIHAAAARSKLMNEFIKKGLLTKSPVKYFIILSDTGMGKTAFLINLYIKYKRSRKKIAKVNYEIKLFPLGDKNALEKITAVNDKKNTILLLDAFDEDIKAVHNYSTRMIEILEHVKEFRKVVFTCRTQFFPSKDEEPTDTNDITFGENIKHKIQKLYLSTFDDQDILKYLVKKYGLNIFKLFRAYKLVKKSPSLMFRPMLLSYINDLITEKLFYNFTFEMYKALIDNWIKREASKPAIAIKSNPDKYSRDLMKFSKVLAKDLYVERENREGYSITIDQLKKMTSERGLNSDVWTLEDKTGRSLLNRNSIGQYKFSHKSILEYFLAVEIFENPDFLEKFDFHGMDATQNFHVEMIANSLKQMSGKCHFISDSKPKNLSTVIPIQISKLEKIIIYNAANEKYENLAGLKHLKILILTDEEFVLMYLMYLFICIEKRLQTIQTHEANKNTFADYVHEYRPILNQVMEIRADIDYNTIRVILDNCETDENTKRLFQKLIIQDKETLPVSANEIMELKELKNYILKGTAVTVRINNALSSIIRIKKLSSFIPNVKIVY